MGKSKGFAYIEFKSEVRATSVIVYLPPPGSPETLCVSWRVLCQLLYRYFPFSLCVRREWRGEERESKKVEPNFPPFTLSLPPHPSLLPAGDFRYLCCNATTIRNGKSRPNEEDSTPLEPYDFTGVLLVSCVSAAVFELSSLIRVILFIVQFAVRVFHSLWSIDWVVDWLGWVGGWLTDWLIDRLIDLLWLIDRSVDRLLDWLIDWLIDWLSDWLIDWF